MNNELLAVVTYFERDRGVSREVIIQAIENAIQHAARKMLAVSPDFRVEIDRKTLNISAKDLLVVSADEDGNGFISLERARRIKPSIKVGDTIYRSISPEKLGRIGASQVRQLIATYIRDAEKQRVYEEFRNRVGDIVSGTVKEFDRRDICIDLGRTLAVMPARECIPTERPAVGDVIRAYIKSVRNDETTAVTLSRACPEFLKALFRREVAEIADGVVEIMGVARDPGFRAKIAVRTFDPKVDPVGACVGVRGARVRNIVRELNGEKIDIVRYQEDIAQYVAQALLPAKATTMEVDPERPNTIHVTVPPDQFSLAVGRRGQNVRLCSRLTGWNIEIERDEPLPEEEPGQEFQAERQHIIERLTEQFLLEPGQAEQILEAGFLTPEGIVAADLPYFQKVTDLPPETAERIWQTAQNLCTPDQNA
ncbi:MAG: transcription termination factor NusA [Kiritimatiellia bacterium]|nr:transcription termination factor NusA [Kiritimatiellia bacterium]